MPCEVVGIGTADVDELVTSVVRSANSYYPLPTAGSEILRLGSVASPFCGRGSV